MTSTVSVGVVTVVTDGWTSINENPLKLIRLDTRSINMNNRAVIAVFCVLHVSCLSAIHFNVTYMY